ncbi:MAG: hypothetical protein IJY44_01590 [Bacteroidaceae bacterium]|nr:hypothetical protein [Bacteroidaceae bacterium]
MRKFTFLIVAAIAMCVSTANAQSKGDMYAGGNLSFGISSWGGGGHMSNSISFSIAPEFGYFVTDNVKVGAEVKYSTSASHSFHVMPNVAYYLPLVGKQLYYTPQFSVGGGFQHGGDTGVFVMSFDLASLEFKPVDNMAISLGLVNLDYTYAGKYNNNVWFNLLTSPKIGFRYYF